MPTLILIRHAETDYVGKRLAGHLPGIHLNQKGKHQAEQLARRLSDVFISEIYSSPLERTVETAESFARLRGLSIKILQELTEINVGDWQGKSLPGLRRLKQWQSIHEQPENFSFPGGESFQNKQRVMCKALEKLVHEADNNSVIACVSHGDPIKLTLAYFLGLRLNNFQRIRIDPPSASFVYLLGDHIRVGPINLVDDIFKYRPGS